MGIVERVFSDKDWRDDLDQDLVRKLEKLLKRTTSYEDAYKQADNPSLAQLWVAVAEMFYQMERTNARIRSLERKQEQLLELVDGVDAERDGIKDRELRDSLDTY
jgi:Asp-tRNA(Asn)/Glu-tRNA(Gln) amidotransferase B subunit